MTLAEMVAEWEKGGQRDYEIRGLVNAYHDGFLDEGGLQWLTEELREYLGGGINL